MYYYADGNDKAGNRLLTSYGKQAQASKYRAGATMSSGEKFLNIQEDGSAKLADEGELLVRTLMVRPAGAAEEMGGRFVVYARVNDKWQPTDFRYKTYAAANAAVKSALINLYQACAVIETGEESTKPIPHNPVDIEEAF